MVCQPTQRPGLKELLVSEPRGPAHAIEPPLWWLRWLNYGQFNAY